MCLNDTYMHCLAIAAHIPCQLNLLKTKFILQHADEQSVTTIWQQTNNDIWQGHHSSLLYYLMLLNQ